LVISTKDYAIPGARRLGVRVFYQDDSSRKSLSAVVEHVVERYRSSQDVIWVYVHSKRTFEGYDWVAAGFWARPEIEPRPAGVGTPDETRNGIELCFRK